MTRLLTAALLLAAAAAPAFACDWNSVSTDTRPSTVASQPADDHGAPPPSPPANQAPS